MPPREPCRRRVCDDPEEFAERLACGERGRVAEVARDEVIRRLGERQDGEDEDQIGAERGNDAGLERDGDAVARERAGQDLCNDVPTTKIAPRALFSAWSAIATHRLPVAA